MVSYKVAFLFFLTCTIFGWNVCRATCSPVCNWQGWQSWDPCTFSGHQNRTRGLCCPKGITDKQFCLKNCSLTDVVQTQNCTPPTTTTTTVSTTTISTTTKTTQSNKYRGTTTQLPSKLTSLISTKRTTAISSQRSRSATSTTSAIQSTTQVNKVPSTANPARPATVLSTAVSSTLKRGTRQHQSSTGGKEKSKSKSVLPAVLGTIGGLLLAAGLAGFLFFVYRKYRQKREKQVEPEKQVETETSDLAAEKAEI